MSFGGKFWPINSKDMNLGQINPSSPLCVGGLLEFIPALNGTSGPDWIVGGTFLKNVYSVFRSSPAAIGFAELSTAAGGSSSES